MNLTNTIYEIEPNLFQVIFNIAMVSQTLVLYTIMLFFVVLATKDNDNEDIELMKRYEDKITKMKAEIHDIKRFNKELKALLITNNKDTQTILTLIKND